MGASGEAEPAGLGAQRVGVGIDPASSSLVSSQQHHAPGPAHFVVGLHIPALQDGAGGGGEGLLGVVRLVQLRLLVGGGVVRLGVRVRQGVGVVGRSGVGRRPAAAVEEASARRRALRGGRGRGVLGRHGRVTEATVGRRILRCVNHLPLEDTEKTNKAKWMRGQ